MNAAARLLNQGVLSRGWVVSLLFNRSQIFSFILAIAALLSALSIIYVTNLSRSLNAEMEKMLAQQQQMHLQWGQLLLEKSTWVMQARVQNVAADKLDMTIPDRKTSWLLCRFQNKQ